MTMDKREIDLLRLRTSAFRTFWSSVLKRRVERSSVVEGSSTLRDVLMVEASRWLELGTQIGYFAAQNSLPPSRLRPIYECFFSMAPAAKGQNDFQEEILLAQETLSLAHCQRLELLQFADEAVWDLKFEELTGFAGQLNRYPGWQPDHKSLEAVQWALLSEAWGDQVNPSFWRLSGLGQYGIGILQEEVDRRLSVLGQVRVTIKRTVDLSIESRMDEVLGQGERPRPSDFG